MYVVMLMSAYWVTEVLPLPVTAMLPMVLFPTMGILVIHKSIHSFITIQDKIQVTKYSFNSELYNLDTSSLNGHGPFELNFIRIIYVICYFQGTDRTCMMYMRETNVMFIGGLIIALAVEHCNLHKRLALKVISIIGCSHRRLVLSQNRTHCIPLLSSISHCQRS